jgi:L-ascorbate metabolism protein UlaG (beta-lactamase superfamily)
MSLRAVELLTMTSETVYLNQNVQAEPLINQWYAWSYLIPPATMSMYVANSHLKIMQSFVAAPQTHVAALKNPNMVGGPFIDYEASRVGEIKQLLSRTVSEQAHMLEMAEAIKNVSATLTTEANGYSLEPLYRKTPGILKGYVELVYDLNNRPAIRFAEPLLYKSRCYIRSSQSLSLSLTTGDHRPFVYSTPKLEGDGSLHLRLPFDDERLDELFKMKDSGGSFEFVREALGIADEKTGLFRSFFTERAPARRPRFDGGGVRIRYFGHACVLIETKKVSILCDPLISYEPASGRPRYTFEDLPDKIDFVLITHNHQDHCLFESLLQIRHKIDTLVVPRSNTGHLADPSLRLILRNIGFKHVVDIEDLETLEVDGVAITGIPFLGEHADLDIRTKIAYLIKAEKKSILLAADSNNIEPKLYEHLHELTGDIDILFLGMECDGAPLSWLYGPLLTQPLSRKTDQSRRFDGSDYEKAIELVNCLKPNQVYVYAMGQEPWLGYLIPVQYTEHSRPIIESDKLVTDCWNRGIESERLYWQKEIFLN